MKNESFIGKKVIIKIDHPIGSNDQDKKFVYATNYGYLDSLDNVIDAYVLGVFTRVDFFMGKCIAIIRSKGEDKLIVTKEENNYTDEQIKSLIEYQEGNRNYQIIRNPKVMSDEFYTLAKNLNDMYTSFTNELEKVVLYILENEEKDLDLIEHTLDSLLDIPTDKAENLYNRLCAYLASINEESYHFYQKEYKLAWRD